MKWRLAEPGEDARMDGCNTGDCTHARAEDCVRVLPRAATVDQFVAGEYGEPDLSGRVHVRVRGHRLGNVVAYDVDAGTVTVLQLQGKATPAGTEWPRRVLRGPVTVELVP